MDVIWSSLLSGSVAAMLAIVGTFWTQHHFKSQEERQQADRERIAMVLDFTGRARGMVMWAVYAHAHLNVIRQWRTQPALLLGQVKAIDPEDFSSTYIEYITELVRLGGRLIAAEGWEVKPAIDDIATVTSELVSCYILPADSRSWLERWVRPAAPIDEERVDELQSRLLRLSAELEHCYWGAAGRWRGTRSSRMMMVGKIDRV